jgi:hypothetical protein
MGFFLVLKAELVRNFIVMRRYWFRTITGMVVGYTMLLMIIVGFMQKGQQVGDLASRLSNADTATSGALGFIMGMFAFGIVGMFTQGLQDMAQNGQLEQLCMSPHGLVTNFLARSFVGSISSVLTSSLLIWLIATSVGGVLHADFPAIILLLTLSFANLIGFGFMVGGLVLVFKQTGQLAVVIRLALFGLAIVATERISHWPALARWLAHILPITDASISLKYVLIHGQMQPVMDSAGQAVLDSAGQQVMQHVSLFAYPSFYFLLVSCLLWTFIGIGCFKAMENWSRNKGTLGAY